MQKKIKVAAICGPTGVGKTETAINLAKSLDAEIISADSMQIYKYMDIGTAKPDMDERCGIRHHLMDFILPDKTYSVADFCEDAAKALEDISSRGKFPLIVGGTGLYIDSLLDGVKFSESVTDENLRKELEEIAVTKGNEFLHSILSEIDPESAEKIHFNNVKRVIRAIEIFKTTGLTKTEQDRNSLKNESPYDCVKICLVRDRDILYQRIDKRVDIMLERGLLKEVGELVSNYNLSSSAVQAIGYKEVISHLKGDISYDEMTELIKRESRRYAKRQLTWFAKSRNCYMLNIDNMDADDSMKACLDIINNTLSGGNDEKI